MNNKKFIVLIIIIISLLTLIDYGFTIIHEELHVKVSNDYKQEVVHKEINFWFNGGSYVETKINNNVTNLNEFYLAQENVDIVGYQLHYVLMIISALILLLIAKDCME